MADQGPPKLDRDERATLAALLQFQRESFVRKVVGVDTEAATLRLVGSDTTLLWLTKHLRYAEILWFRSRFAGDPLAVLPSDTVGPEDTIDVAIDAYRTEWARSDAAIAAAGLDDRCARYDEAPVNLRWVMAHMLEETARHAGHADIIREIIDGHTGR